MDIRTKRKLLQEFLKNNGGGVKIDFKKKDIIIQDGSLWSIEKKKVKVPKMLKSKPLPDGGALCVFSKKQFTMMEDYDTYLWIEELRETINYFKRLDKLLIKMGYDTSRSYGFKEAEE